MPKIKTTKRIDNLDQILCDLTAYLEPNFLQVEYRTKIDTSNIDKAKLMKYFKLLTSISRVYKKVQKYELFFAEFYPETKKIKKHEALEHHIHAYLEDLIMLKNKITTFLGALKNDLKKIAKNKKEINIALTWLIGEVNRVFDNVSKYRDPHHHKGLTFIDGDLIDSEMAHMVTKNDSPLRDLFKSEFIDELKKRETESFEKAKRGWVSMAKKNNAEISGLVNDVLERNKSLLYKLLNIKSVDDIII